jgi:protein TonB
MLAFRTSTSLSALGLVLGIAGTSWLTALTYERAPATRPFAEVVMPGSGKVLPTPKAGGAEPVSGARPLREQVRSPQPPAGSQQRTAGLERAAAPERVLSSALGASRRTVASRRVSESLVPVYTPSPRYPMSALRANREGQVVLSVTVTPEGDVTDVTVGRSSGDLDLDRAAEEAVRNWRFAAADDRATRYTADLPIRFELTRPF